MLLRLHFRKIFLPKMGFCTNFLERHSRKLLPYTDKSQPFGDPFHWRQKHLELISDFSVYSYEMVRNFNEFEAEVEGLMTKNKENFLEVLGTGKQKQFSEHSPEKRFESNDSIIYYRERNSQREFLIIGVIHIYQESAIQVIKSVEEFKPETLVLELCPDRLNHLEKKYEKFDPGVVYKALKETPKTLKYLFKPSLEFVVGVEGAKRLESHCEVVDGDLSKYDIMNNLQRYRDQCRCPKTISLLIHHVANFFGILRRGVFRYLLRRLANETIKIDRSTLLDFGLIKPEKKISCVEDKLQYEREFNFFKKMIQSSRSKRILGVVGLYHLKSLRKFFQIYDRVSGSLDQVDVEKYMNDLEFPKIESRELYELAVAENQRKMEEELKFYEKLRYCNHQSEE